MSADRYELRADHTDWLDVRDPQGYRNTINQPGAVALIRQQCREIAELRTNLAAAVAARANMDTDRLEWMSRAEQAEARLARNTCEHCDGTGDVHTPTGEWRGECDCVYAQNNKLRARLAAIEAAPTVASMGIDVLGKPRALYFPPPHRSAFAAKIDAVGGWTIKELIARPAKD